MCYGNMDLGVRKNFLIKTKHSYGKGMGSVELEGSEEIAGARGQRKEETWPLSLKSRIESLGVKVQAGNG